MKTKKVTIEVGLLEEGDDLHVYGFGLNWNEATALGGSAGEFGVGKAFIPNDEIVRALKQAKPRSDADILAYIDENNLEITHEQNIFGYRYIEVTRSSSACPLVGAVHGIQSVKDAIGYLMDMEDEA